MAKRLETSDRDLLNFRPKIDYIEPEVEPDEIKPVSEELPQLEDVLDRRIKVMKLAKAVDILATFMQARADEKAKDMVIDLDPTVDGVVIQAMGRRFPGTNATRITYQQYRECKDLMREAGKNIANKVNVTTDQIDAVREDAINTMGGATIRDSNFTNDLNISGDRTQQALLGKGQVSGLGTDAGKPDLNSLLNNTPKNIATTAAKGNKDGNTTTPGLKTPSISGWNTSRARKGGLRPELDKTMQIVEPLNMIDIQYSLICILVNFIWKNFILNAFNFKILGKRISSFLPQKLCDSGSIEAPDLIILGAEPPDLFTQKPPSIADIAPEVEV